MNELSISKDKLLELYPDVKDYSRIFYEEPKSDEDFIQNYLSSKLWRLNNLYTIVDKYGNKIPFVMNPSQHIVYSATLEHPRIIILKSRQQGISTLWLVSYFDDALFIPDYNIGLMAQGEDESTKLLTRVKFAWETFPQEVKDFMNIKLVKDNTKEFAFSNNSTIFIRTSFRSTTLQRLHISEFGKIANANPKRAKETKTGTMQAVAPGNTVVIESTAEGENEFKSMWDTAADFQGNRAPKDFKPVFLSWMQDPDCNLDVDQIITDKQLTYFSGLEAETGTKITKQQRNFWVAQYRELGNDIYQEYPSTPAEAFQASREGSYYNTIYRNHVLKYKREVVDLYDPNLDVHVAIDLGMNDDNVLVFFQVHKGEFRIIDEYRNSGEGIKHYVNQMFSRPYKYGTTFLPHDAKVKELTSGKTRLARFNELGVRNTKVLPKLRVNDGIEAVRKIIPNLWIDARCDYLIKCFKNYSKDWDDRRGVWKNEPLHDKYSHGADAIRYMAIGIQGNAVTKEKMRRFRKQNVVGGMAF